MQFQILKFEIENSVGAHEMVGIDKLQLGKLKRIASEQLVDLLEMVGIDMQVTKGVYEFADLETTDVSDQVSKQGVAADVKGHP